MDPRTDSRTLQEFTRQCLPISYSLTRQLAILAFAHRVLNTLAAARPIRTTALIVQRNRALCFIGVWGLGGGWWRWFRRSRLLSCCIYGSINRRCDSLRHYIGVRCCWFGSWFGSGWFRCNGGRSASWVRYGHGLYDSTGNGGGVCL